MAPYVYSLGALALDFICLILCLKFIFSHKGLVWFIPMIMSIAFMLISALCLLAEVSDSVDPSLSDMAAIVTNFILALSFIWFIIVLVFKAALNKTKSYKDAVGEVNMDEAQYIKNESMPDSYMEYLASEKEKKKNERLEKKKSYEKQLRQQKTKKRNEPVAALPLRKCYGYR